MPFNIPLSSNFENSNYRQYYGLQSGQQVPPNTHPVLIEAEKLIKLDSVKISDYRSTENNRYAVNIEDLIRKRVGNGNTLDLENEKIGDKGAEKVAQMDLSRNLKNIT